MAWYYEILGKNKEVVEQSEAIYSSALDAQYAAQAERWETASEVFW
jgi:molybdopterin converting factor small subunit